MTEKVSLDLSVRNTIIISFIAGTLLGIVIGGIGTMTIQNPGQNTLEATSPDNSAPGSDTTTTQNQDKNSNTVSVADLTWKDDPVLGSKDAEVTIVWFSDLNCMYCQRFAQNTFPEIRENFVKHDKVRVVKKDFITMGANSVTLAKASQATWQLVGEENPEVFWTWSDTISENQDERKRNSKNVTEDIISTTRTVDGINAEQLRQRMNEINEKEIQEDIRQGKQRGISGTPGFLIFETGSDQAMTITGAQPYSTFSTEINNLLEN